MSFTHSSVHSFSNDLLSKDFWLSCKLRSYNSKQNDQCPCLHGAQSLMRIFPSSQIKYAVTHCVKGQEEKAHCMVRGYGWGTDLGLDINEGFPKEVAFELKSEI